ncbi:hypothetical protein FGO68_gene11566 [Halteria grandinella]|uniref:Uncharacterized protein n=1 Tax=Halteria grandinella TaxID=5974 RepID=A0A8J8NPG4_HALGN|nr:hypothetical protein FGO68_gene11566 [Halteria grandinella]
MKPVIHQWTQVQRENARDLKLKLTDLRQVTLKITISLILPGRKILLRYPFQVMNKRNYVLKSIISQYLIQKRNFFRKILHWRFSKKILTQASHNNGISHFTENRNHLTKFLALQKEPLFGEKPIEYTYLSSHSTLSISQCQIINRNTLIIIGQIYSVKQRRKIQIIKLIYQRLLQMKQDKGHT